MQNYNKRKIKSKEMTKKNRKIMEKTPQILVKNTTVEFWTTFLVFFTFCTSENMPNFASHNN